MNCPLDKVNASRLSLRSASPGDPALARSFVKITSCGSVRAPGLKVSNFLSSKQQIVHSSCLSVVYLHRVLLFAWQSVWYVLLVCPGSSQVDKRTAKRSRLTIATLPQPSHEGVLTVRICKALSKGSAPLFAVALARYACNLRYLVTLTLKNTS